MTLRDRALALLSDAAAPAEGDVPLYGSDADAIAAAQVLATLEVAEQQRIANLIALGSREFDVPGGASHVSFRVFTEIKKDGQTVIDINPAIKEGLGL